MYVHVRYICHYNHWEHNFNAWIKTGGQFYHSFAKSYSERRPEY